VRRSAVQVDCKSAGSSKVGGGGEVGGSRISMIFGGARSRRIS
jgi:hypothetical protein